MSVLLDLSDHSSKACNFFASVFSARAANYCLSMTSSHSPWSNGSSSPAPSLSPFGVMILTTLRNWWTLKHLCNTSTFTQPWLAHLTPWGSEMWRLISDQSVQLQLSTAGENQEGFCKHLLSLPSLAICTESRVCKNKWLNQIMYKTRSVVSGYKFFSCCASCSTLIPSVSANCVWVCVCVGVC